MNAFYEHHHDNIRFGYRCFDRILLNAAIQPFQQPERAVGFFWTYRHIYPVSRQVLRDIARAALLKAPLGILNADSSVNTALSPSPMSSWPLCLPH